MAVMKSILLKMLDKIDNECGVRLKLRMDRHKCDLLWTCEGIPGQWSTSAALAMLHGVYWGLKTKGSK